jgi:hypothetical protein
MKKNETPKFPTSAWRRHRNVGKTRKAKLVSGLQVIR